MDTLQCTEVRSVTAIVMNPQENRYNAWAEIISGGTFLFLYTYFFTIVTKNTSSAGSNLGGCVD